jgi:hypothetical protein
MRVLEIFAAVTAVGLAALLIYAGARPDTFKVVRAIGIKAPPEKIYALMDDFHEFSKWSPYEQLDPKMARTYSGPSSGPGATYEWRSDGKAGAGRMEIVDAAAPSRIDIRLSFTKPFESHNAVTFLIEPQGQSTRVTWIMQGASPFISKLLGVFFNMDAMIGGDFEKGLADLKRLAES